METTESLGYLKGLMDGLDLDPNKKETKVFNAIISVLENLTEDIDDMTEGLELVADQIDQVDEDLADLEDFVYEDDYDDCDCCDDEEYEVVCPCCGEVLEFDFDCDDEGCCDCEDCE